MRRAESEFKIKVKRLHGHYMSLLHNIQNIYFIGIGGIGMSALARFAKLKGLDVYGYDKTKTLLTEVSKSPIQMRLLKSQSTYGIPKKPWWCIHPQFPRIATYCNGLTQKIIRSLSVHSYWATLQSTLYV